MESDRRLTPRAHVRMPVTVLFERRPVPGDLLDISVGGMRFSCRAEIEVRDRVEVRLRVANAPECSGLGAVVRAGDARGFGVEFEETSEGMRAFVADLLRLSPALHADFIASVVDPTVMVRNLPGSTA